MKALANRQPTTGLAHIVRRVAATISQPLPRLAHQVPILQRQAACACGGGCPRCQEDALALQAKLKIGRPGDQYEQEADRISEHMMRMPEPIGQPKVCSSPSCKQAEEDEAVQAKSHGNAGALLIRSVLASPGQPLDAATRSFMEPRFGRDFGGVRVHTGRQAADSARALDARAYTVGRDVVFGEGEYTPGTSEGRRLMAHELTHVLQQEAGLSNTAQRACGAEAIGAPAACTHGEVDVDGPRYLFVANCDEFRTGNELDLRRDACRIRQNDIIEIHGYASIEGDPGYNMNLSCARALKAREVVLDELSKRDISVTIRLFKHGATEGNRDLWRSVTVTRVTAGPPERSEPRCGPDATVWFVDVVNRARSDPDVSMAKRHMDSANILSRHFGTTAADVAEGGVTARVIAEEARLKVFGPSPPARNPTIDTQLRHGIVAQSRAVTALAINPYPSDFLQVRANAERGLIMYHIQSAASGWAALVTHGARYDFKAHVLNKPKRPPCPDIGCVPREVGTVTLCPGSTSVNCYESDLPGNLFYARIGRFIGFSLNTLQLGSQFAELTDVTPRPTRPALTWDSPEDTAAIDLGYYLPLPLTASALCQVVPPRRAILSLPATTNCSDCLVVM